MNKLLFALYLIALPALGWSQQDSVKTEIKPTEVKRFGVFKVSFSCSCSPDSISQVQIPRYIEVMSGPNRSSSTSIANGKMNTTTTITYLLKANKPGEYSFTSPRFVSEGQTLVSSTQKMTVLSEVASEKEQEIGKKTSSVFDNFFNQNPPDTTLTYRIVIQADSGYVTQSRGKYGRGIKVRDLSNKEVSKLLKSLKLPTATETK
ncbi:BatD family protein [bacterium SCSIO 12741]|nr:BatD family protein [bacterium SCSIO 12741]